MCVSMALVYKRWRKGKEQSTVNGKSRKNNRNGNVVMRKVDNNLTGAYDYDGIEGAEVTINSNVIVKNVFLIDLHRLNLIWTKMRLDM